YYGDGAVRQLKPLSPALHLGAERLFIIGVSDNPRGLTYQPQDYRSPSLAQMISHILNSAFIDTIESDLETLRSINTLTNAIPEDERERQGLAHRPIDNIFINPSQPINAIAEEFIHELPRSVRTFLRITGANSKGGGSSAASYLLFEPGFCGYLID